MKLGWEVKPLGEFAETITKGTTPTSVGFKFSDTGINFVKIEAISSDGQISQNKLAKIPQAAHDALARSQLKAGDVLFSIAGALGRIAIVDSSVLPANTNQALSIIRLKQDAAIDRNYLAYCLASSATAEQIAQQKGGVAQQNLSLAQVKAFEIPIPPLEEQKQIVAILDAAFEGLTRAKENAKANLQNARDLFESALSDLFAQSKSWEVSALNDHVAFMDYRGKTPPKREKGIRLITAKNVKRGFIQVEPLEFIEAAAYDGWMTRGFPSEGDVLFTTEAPLANVAQLDTSEKVVIGQRLITMKPDLTKIDREFLKFALMSPQMQEEIFSFATGATVLGIKAKLLKAVQFKFPRSLTDQQKIAALCRKSFARTDELVEMYTTKLTDIADLRQSLLQKAFAGELT